MNLGKKTINEYLLMNNYFNNLYKIIYLSFHYAWLRTLGDILRATAN